MLPNIGQRGQRTFSKSVRCDLLVPKISPQLEILFIRRQWFDTEKETEKETVSIQ